MSSLLLAPAAVAGDPGPRDLEDQPPKMPPRDGIDVEISDEAAPRSWATRDRLLGDAGGVRSWLNERGLGIEIVSLDEGFGAPAATGNRSSAKCSSTIRQTIG